MKNARKLKDWLVIGHFGASFHLNETMYFKQNDAVSCVFFKKKRDETMSFWDGTVSSSSSPGCVVGEEKLFCFLPRSPCALLKPKPDTTRTSSWWEDRKVVPRKRRLHWPPRPALQQCRRHVPHAWAAMGWGRVNPAPPAPINSDLKGGRRRGRKWQKTRGERGEKKEGDREREADSFLDEERRDRKRETYGFSREKGEEKRREREDNGETKYNFNYIEKWFKLESIDFSPI